MKTVEAIIEPGGGVRLVEPVQVPAPRRALVTILDEAPVIHETALLSETALAGDWNRVGGCRMGAFAAGQVVIVRFPFSDLTAAKLRPAVVLADVGRGDWILCQITSKSYGDSHAIALTDSDFASGSLHLSSYVRPGKLFTAHASLVAGQVGGLRPEMFSAIRSAVVRLIQRS